MRRKNLGLGRTIRWAMLTAINRLYGERHHFATRRTHFVRSRVFAAYCRRSNLSDVTEIKQATLDDYCRYLAIRIDHEYRWPDGHVDKPISVAYAQNLLSTANTVMLALYGNTGIWLSPSKALQKARCFVRTKQIQAEEAVVMQATHRMQQRVDPRCAALTLLCYRWGMRFQEAALQDLDRMMSEAKKLKEVTILEGTKGGRKCPSRYIKATQSRLDALDYALSVRPIGSSCLLAPSENVRRFYQTIGNRCRRILQQHKIPHFRELRAAFAAEEYLRITGVHPFSALKPSREKDLEARQEIARQLGHGRPFVSTSYIGGY